MNIFKRIFGERKPKPHKHDFTIPDMDNGARVYRCSVKRCKAFFDIGTIRNEDRWEQMMEKHYREMKSKNK